MIGSRHQATAKSAKKRLTHRAFNTAAVDDNTSVAAAAARSMAAEDSRKAVGSRAVVEERLQPRRSS